MKYQEEFRDQELVKALLDRIGGLKKSMPLRVMEVCGGHTMAIRRNGLDSLVSRSVRFLSGPGCPVCVTAVADIDKALALAAVEGAVVCIFGDLLKVPGSTSSLMEMKARGADIRVVYSVRDALEFSRKEPGCKFAFIGIGFETTTPSIAAAVKEARASSVRNFSVLSLHKTMPAALETLLSDPGSRIEAFLLPGHVSTIIGTGPYGFIADRYGISGCVSGFEPADILSAVVMLLESAKSGIPAITNAYPRVCRPEGNPAAVKVMNEVFEPCDASWRGFGVIPGSGLSIRKEFEAFDAEKVFGLRTPSDATEFAGCLCGEVLKGKKEPSDCGHFGKACTPDNPKGACMVSSEGVCSAWYQYGPRSTG